MKHLKFLSLIVGLGLVAAIWGELATVSSASAAAGKVGGKLVLGSELGETWSCQFNPFNPAENLLSLGFTYEPLEFVDVLKTNSNGTNKVTPWLASGSSWSNNYETLTFTVRRGVKWSDGSPFTAADVAYTFNAMTTSPALDLNGLWAADGGPLTSVAVAGTDQVVFKFNSDAFTDFYFIADQTPIVPQHIWSKLNQSKLASFDDDTPVGTGPYLVHNCSQDNIEYLRNPHYWQSRPGHPVPRVEQIDYPAYLSNPPANLALVQGQDQWGAQPIPDIKSSYIAKDPKYRHYWFPPLENVSLFPNLTNPLLGQLAVRKAISLALDRPEISSRGESGYEPPANQTGIVTPTYKKWYDASANDISYSPGKADQVLRAAGFTKGSDGVYQNAQGQPLSFTIKTVSGFSDWDASLQVITQELKAVGIQVTVQDENSGPYVSDLESGNFQLGYAGGGGPYPVAGPTPYYELRGVLFGGNIGSTNYERYNSASTDALFNDYAADSSSPTKQLQVMDQIEKVMVDDLPIIPVTEAVDWFEYDGKDFGGFPSPSDPYAQPVTYEFPDDGVILTHIFYKG